MIRKLFLTGVIVILMGVVSPTALASSLNTKQVQAKKVYYHSQGYIDAIWKNARRTVYHPNKKKAKHWWNALRFLEKRSAHAWKILHPVPPLDQRLVPAFSCIHHYEGAWNANTGNGFYGGLQMDLRFQSSYGADFMARWGTADNWPIWAQLQAAIRAYKSGRGFYPWPNTARACGLI